VRGLLGVTRAEMLKMDDVLERLARQAGAFSGTIEKARVRTRAIGGKLRDLDLPALATEDAPVPAELAGAEASDEVL
jgi:DNA recombination protein RmuC